MLLCRTWRRQLHYWLRNCELVGMLLYSCYYFCCCCKLPPLSLSSGLQQPARFLLIIIFFLPVFFGNVFCIQDGTTNSYLSDYYDNYDDCYYFLFLLLVRVRAPPVIIIGIMCSCIRAHLVGSCRMRKCNCLLLDFVFLLE